ncbi:MAG: hypothetical protein U9R01_05170, partial [candidate division WOR-3 bacterium]|nr:hypothetical protein [candidate division WOR-3 bacterium]
VTLSIDRYPALNDTALVTCEIFLEKFLGDTTQNVAEMKSWLYFGDSTIYVYFPPLDTGLAFVGGDSCWSGIMREGDTGEYSAFVKATKIGKWMIAGRAKYDIDTIGSYFGDGDALFLWVKEDTGYSWRPW